MEHITIQPTKVRGQGNVLNPKTLEEYEKISCELGVEDDIFTLTPLFFKLGFKKTSTNNYSTQFYTNTNLTVDAAVNYNNESVNDERVSNQDLKLYMDGELKYSGKTDSKGEWSQSLGKLSLGDHEFQLKFKDSWSPISYIHIEQSIGTISLRCDQSETYLGKNIVFTATVKDINNNLAANQQVQFINTITGEILSTVYTNANGECTFTHSQSNEEEGLSYCPISITATCTDVNSNTVNVKYWNHDPESVTVEPDDIRMVMDDSMLMIVTFFDHFHNEVSGIVHVEGALSREYSSRRENNSYIITYTPSSVGNKVLKIYLSRQPDVYATVNITVNKADTSVTLTTPDWAKYETGGYYICSTVLTNTSIHKGIPNANLIVYINDTTSQVTTGDEGAITFGQAPSRKGIHTLKVVYEGDQGHNSSESSTNTVCVGANLTLDVEITKN